MITVINPGLLTTVQDLGRFCWQRYGIVVSGAMDPLSHRLANILVSNDENLPTLEITLIGPKLRFDEKTVIALCGADLSAQLNGETIPLGTPIAVEKDDILSFGKPNRGCRTYLAVHGGIEVNPVFQSYSTYVRAQLGGYKGRPLQKGDQLSIKKNESFFNKVKKIDRRWSISTYFFHPFSNNIRIMRGKQFSLFTTQSQTAFLQKPFTISTDSDRMGYRLNGPKLELVNNHELISEGVSFGSIQVPKNGEPIALLADRQTVGGYPKIAQIASVDFPIIAQKRPGETVTFSEISIEQSQRLFIQQEQKIKQLKRAIQLQFQ